MITIGIDGNEANQSNRVGSNVYAYQILKALKSFSSQSNFIIYLKDQPVKDMPKATRSWRYQVITPQKFWTQFRLPLELILRSRHLDVFFTPSHYAPRFSPIPYVNTIFDLSFLHHPDHFLKLKRGLAQLTQWTEYSARHAAAIIAISAHTKKDVAASYQIDPSQIHIAYPGIDRDFYRPAPKSHISRVKLKYRTTDHYILSVGTIQPRKNYSRLLDAFAQLPSKYRHFKLVIAGQKGWLYDDFLARLARSPRKSDVILTGFVPSADVPALYTGSACHALIGLYEGFGMPAAESLACGTIPVVSQNSSLPEVVGKHGILVDPFSVDSIRSGLLKALSLNPTARRRLLAGHDQHLDQFAWPHSAAVIYKVLYDIAVQRQTR